MPFRVESHAEPIPGYRLIERLGGGGFGEVWKAEAPGGLHKAIKFVFGELRSASDDNGSGQGQRAEQEYKALSRVKSVRHPYILSLERFDVVENQLIIVMELADKNLWDRYRECKAEGSPGIPREELLRYMEESAEALDLMNMEYQLQHLDIKPQNIFLVHSHVKVADFGLVKDFQGVAASMTGGVTPVYAAPETFDGMVTRFCDQYSLAIVYQELLTGQRPFTGVNIHQLVMQHVQGRPNLSSLNDADRAVVARALSKNPDDRFPSCSEMVRALRAAGGTPSSAAFVLPDVAVSGAAVTQPPYGSGPNDATHGPQSLPPIGGMTTIPPIGLGGVTTMPPPTNDTDSVGLETVHTRDLPRIHLGPQDTSAAPIKVSGPRPEPPEVTGNGELFPALVVGLGQIGLGALQQLSFFLQRRFGSADATPHLRLFGIDTDAESVQAATEEGRTAALPQAAVIHARLNRAIHYMKPREGRPRLDAWFDSGFLNRLPRTLTTGGLRALGRLAFVDNYRPIAQRLREELKVCLDPESMSAAIGHTGLALRTNRPRVYVIAGLGGGTGGGMFIDVAYALRRQLKEFGYADPEVIGLFLLPPLEKGANQKETQVNTFAALTELNHFSSEGVTFTARFDEKEGNVTDPQPPFRRFAVLHLPAEEDKAARESVLAQAGNWLYRELVTPVGKAADTARAAVPAPENARNLACQNFGLARFWWPRWALLQRAARRLCRHLAQQWMSKESTTPPELIQGWVQEQWTQQELSLEIQVNRIKEACQKALGQDPETAIAPTGELFIAKRWGGKQLDANAVRESVARVEKFLGRPNASSVLCKPGVLEDTMKAEADAMLVEWDKKLLAATAQLVERPEFHLAGAEEAIRQLTAFIDQVLQNHETLSKELSQKASRDNERIQVYMQDLDDLASGGRGTAQFINELVELLGVYPKVRYQSMMLRLVNQTYVQLRNKLADQLREVGFFRTRLAELQRCIEELDLPGQNQHAPDAHQLLPAGCKTLSEAVDRFIAALTPAEFEELDRHMHHLIQVQFRGLTHLCNSSSTVFKSLASAMLSEAVAFTAARLQATDVVEMFLGQFDGDEEAQRALATAYEKAAPASYVPGITSHSEFCILAAPPSPHEERLRQLAGQAVAGAPLTPAASADDIVFYREESRLALDELEVLGPLVREAYRLMDSTDPGAAHTRTDISEWRQIVFK